MFPSSRYEKKNMIYIHKKCRHIDIYISAPFNQEYKESQSKTDKLKYSEPDRQFCGDCYLEIKSCNFQLLETPLDEMSKMAYLMSILILNKSVVYLRPLIMEPFCKSSSGLKAVNCFPKKPIDA